MGLGRKKGGGHGGGGGGHDGSGGLRWLLTYADMITLLLALFVYLFSISEVSASKLASFSTSFASYFGLGALPTNLVSPSGGDSVLPLPGMRRPSDQPSESKRKQSRIRSLAPMLRREEYRELQNKVSEVLPGLVNSGQLSFLETREGLVLRLRDSALFGLGSAGMSDAAKQTLDTLAETLRNISNPVRVEGHTDNLPVRGGSYKSNWELSGARAAAVVEYFMNEGVAPERLSISGYGEYRPLEPNQPGVGNPRNRRVEILILNSARPIGYAEGLPPAAAVEGEKIVLPEGMTPVAPAAPDGGANPPAPSADASNPAFHTTSPEGSLPEVPAPAPSPVAGQAP